MGFEKLAGVEIRDALQVKRIISVRVRLHGRCSCWRRLCATHFSDDPTSKLQFAGYTKIISRPKQKAPAKRPRIARCGNDAKRSTCRKESPRRRRPPTACRTRCPDSAGQKRRA